MNKTVLPDFLGNRKIENIILGIVAIGLITYLAILSKSYYDFVVCPFFNEYREGAQIDAIKAFVEGRSFYPSNPESAPFYLYGPVYPVIVGLLGGMGLFNVNWLIFARLVSFLCSISIAIIGGKLIYDQLEGLRKGYKLLICLIGFAFLLRTNLVSVYGIANPGVLGALFVVISLVAASKGKVYIAAIVSVIPFFIKAYFLVVVLPLSVYFLIRDKRMFFKYAIVSLTAFVCVWGLIITAYPYSIYYMILHHHVAASTAYFDAAERQIIGFATSYLPIVFLFVVGIVRDLKRKEFANLKNVYFLSAILMFIPWLRLGAHLGGIPYMYIYNLWYALKYMTKI